MIRTIVVDDEPATAVIVENMIRREMLPLEVVASASNGRKALELINEIDPELIFMDIRMPFKNGLDVMREAPDHTYIIITAYDQFEYAQDALRLGAKDLLVKPIKTDQFRQAIERAVGWNFTKSPDVNKVIEFVNKNYRENFEVSKLAKDIFTTPTSLARLFKKHMDMSILTYLHTVRINQAVKLLKAGEMSISEISKEVGYENINNFYKYFKRFNDMTPAEFISRKG